MKKLGERLSAKKRKIASHMNHITNHIERNYNLSNKKALFFNMKAFYEATF